MKPDWRDDALLVGVYTCACLLVFLFWALLGSAS